MEHKTALPDDAQIIALFYARDEQALRLAAQKYRADLYAVAQHILRNHADTEECLNDTYLDAWNHIPPANPKSLGAYLATIARRRALDRYRRTRRKKRGAGAEVLPLDEAIGIDEICQNPTQELEARRIAEALNAFLATLSDQNRYLFVGHYYLHRPVATLAAAQGLSRSAVHKRLAALRRTLQAHLESEGISV